MGIAASSGWAGARRLCYERRMPLHLIKLAVGADSLSDLREWMAERMAEARRRRAPLRHAHVTRMTPKRTEAILDGGSLYWVVKGLISARQEIVGLEPFVDADGIGRCKIWLEQNVVAVAPRPMRAFQGWQLLRGEGRAARHRRGPARLRRDAGGAAPGTGVARAALICGVMSTSRIMWRKNRPPYIS